MRPLVLLSFLGVFVGTFASGFSNSAFQPTSALLASRPHPILSPAAPLPLDSHPAMTAVTTTSMKSRGGAMEASSSSVEGEGKCPFTKTIHFLFSLWGTFGVVYILLKAIKRVLPIAMEPFKEGAVPLSQVQLGAYIVTCLWFAYVEGYKGFQRKFSPLVVARSLSLEYTSPIHHWLLGPFYSMGLFHATKKRMIVSWSVTLGVAAIVAAVKRMPYPWRNIVDAGVVAGLSWGTISMLVEYIKAIVTAKFPDIDPALPKRD